MFYIFKLDYVENSSPPKLRKGFAEGKKQRISGKFL
jgi:hypothetical protein